MSRREGEGEGGGGEGGGGERRTTSQAPNIGCEHNFAQLTGAVQTELLGTSPPIALGLHGNGNAQLMMEKSHSGLSHGNLPPGKGGGSAKSSGVSIGQRSTSSSDSLVGRGGRGGAVGFGEGTCEFVPFVGAPEEVVWC